MVFWVSSGPWLLCRFLPKGRPCTRRSGPWCSLYRDTLESRTGAIEHSWRAEGQTGTHSVCSRCDRLGGPGSGQNALPIGSRCCSCGEKNITISRAERVLFYIVITKVERETGSNKNGRVGCDSWNVQPYLARPWTPLRWGKNAGSQIRPCSWQAVLQEVLAAARTTWSALSGGQLVALEQKSWEEEKKRERAEINAAVDTAERTRSWRFSQPVFQPGHWLSGASPHRWTHREHRARSGTETRWRMKRTCGILRLCRWFHEHTHSLVDDTFDSSLHICGIVHINHPHIRLSYGLGVRVLWCHLHRESFQNQPEKSIYVRVSKTFLQRSPSLTSLMLGLSLKKSEFSLVCGGSNFGFRKMQPLAKASKGAGPS